MSALWIAHVTVTHEETYMKYVAMATDCIAAYYGVFLARGSRYQQMEGRDRPRNVVARFPSFERAVECYNSDMYGEALKLAKVSAERDLVIVEEVE